MAATERKTKRQFLNLTEDDLKRLKESSIAPNTKKATQTAITAFRDFLETKGMDSNFEEMDSVMLDREIGLFFVGIRAPDGSLYKKTTLQSYRHSIQRHIASKRDDIDIIKGIEFKASNSLFQALLKEVKKQGKGKVEHHPAIEEEDMRRLYNYLCVDDSADQLQKKVYYD